MVARDWGCGGVNYKGVWGNSGSDGVFEILFRVVVTLLHAFIKAHRTIH